MLEPPYFSLGAEIAREQEDVYAKKQLSELDLLRSMGRTRQRAVRRYRELAVGLFGLCVVVTALGVGLAFKYPVVQFAVAGEATSAPREDGFGHWVVASAGEPKQVKFSDGSAAIIAAGSRIRVVRASRRGVAMTLESGSIELRVAGSRLTEYLVGVGPFSLAVAKGRVELSWDPMNELLDLVVHEGYVVISGCQFAEGRSVVAGKELGTRCIAR